MISDIQVKQFHEEGYFLTEPMFDQETLDKFYREADRLYVEAVRAAEADGNARNIEMVTNRPFIGHAHTQSEFMCEFIKAPIYLEACAKLIGSDADLYFNQVVTKPPEKGKSFAWHQDSGYEVTEPLQYITCWTAISRSFVENGCIWIVPGSHKWGLQEHVYSEEAGEYQVQVDESNATPVEMRPGQVAIFSSLMLHKSGPNTSTEIRLGYVPQYHVPGVLSLRRGEPGGDQFPVLRDGQRYDEN